MPVRRLLMLLRKLLMLVWKLLMLAWKLLMLVRKLLTLFRAPGAMNSQSLSAARWRYAISFSAGFHAAR